MSLTAVRPYFRARAASSSWKEWKDVFDENNIPSTLIDGSFHLPPFTTNVSRQNQLDAEISVSQKVTYFRKGFQNVADGLDKAISGSETFIKACLKASNRLTGAGIKNVTLAGVSHDQVGNNNDIIKVSMDFQVLVIIDTETGG